MLELYPAVIQYFVLLLMETLIFRGIAGTLVWQRSRDLLFPSGRRGNALPRGALNNLVIWSLAFAYPSPIAPSMSICSAITDAKDDPACAFRQAGPRGMAARPGQAGTNPANRLEETDFLRSLYRDGRLIRARLGAPASDKLGECASRRARHRPRRSSKGLFTGERKVVVGSCRCSVCVDRDMHVLMYQEAAIPPINEPEIVYDGSFEREGIHGRVNILAGVACGLPHITGRLADAFNSLRVEKLVEVDIVAVYGSGNYLVEGATEVDKLPVALVCARNELAERKWNFHA